MAVRLGQPSAQQQAPSTSRLTRRSLEQRTRETRERLGLDGLRAATVVWLIVNAVNVLQAIGFATRPFAPQVNPALGLVIAVLAIPATWALLVFVRIRAGWLFVAGPIAFDVFVVLYVLVDRLLRVEWRDPAVPAILVPYVALFFGSIFLMGLPMVRIDRGRWLVTVATTAALLLAMTYAISMRVG